MWKWIGIGYHALDLVGCVRESRVVDFYHESTEEDEKTPEEED